MAGKYRLRRTLHGRVSPTVPATPPTWTGRPRSSRPGPAHIPPGQAARPAANRQERRRNAR